jgi:hypothetical protein
VLKKTALALELNTIQMVVVVEWKAFGTVHQPNHCSSHIQAFVDLLHVYLVSKDALL